MSQVTRRALLDRVADLGRRIPTASIDSICAALESKRGAAGLGAVGPILASVHDAATRKRLGQLLSDWAAANPESPALSLAWALRGASATDENRRRSSSLQLVWTGPAPPFGVLRRTEQALLEVIRAASEDLWLVSFAGYKVPSIADALSEAAVRGVSIKLILETAEASQGKATFLALEGVGHHLAEIASVFIWPLEKRDTDEKGNHGSLHVKCALADDEVLLVSSANLTEYAMTLNMELGLLVREDDLPRKLGQHFRWLVQQKILAPVPRD